MKKTLLASLKTQISEAEDKLESLKEANRLLAEYGLRNATFEVQIYSNWDGEQDLKIREQLPLSKLIPKAEAAFMTVNRRSDVQGKYYVYVVVGRHHLMVTDKLWRKYTQKK